MSNNRNVNWDVSVATHENAQLAVLMDIRDEMKRSNDATMQLLQLARCHRLPRALDAIIELGAEARRKKRAAAKRNRRKAARK